MNLRKQWGIKPRTTAKTAFLDSGHIGIGGIRVPDTLGHKYEHSYVFPMIN